MVTFRIVLEDGLVLDVVGDILGSEEGQADTGQQLGGLVTPGEKVEIQPLDQGLQIGAG